MTPQPDASPKSPAESLVEKLARLKYPADDPRQMAVCNEQVDRCIAIVRRHYEGQRAVAGKPLDLQSRDELLAYIRAHQAEETQDVVERLRLHLIEMMEMSKDAGALSFPLAYEMHQKTCEAYGLLHRAMGDGLAAKTLVSAKKDKPIIRDNYFEHDFSLPQPTQDWPESAPMTEQERLVHVVQCVIYDNYPELRRKILIKKMAEIIVVALPRAIADETTMATETIQPITPVTTGYITPFLGDVAVRPTADRGYSEQAVGGGVASPANSDSPFFKLGQALFNLDHSSARKDEVREEADGRQLLRAQSPASEAYQKVKESLQLARCRCMNGKFVYDEALAALPSLVPVAPREISVADKERLVNDMAKAYALLEYPKRTCSSCGGDGREQDDTPCSNPNERGMCTDCKGNGYWQAQPTFSDRFRAAFAVVEPYLRTTEPDTYEGKTAEEWCELAHRDPIEPVTGGPVSLSDVRNSIEVRSARDISELIEITLKTAGVKYVD